MRRIENRKAARGALAALALCVASALAGCASPTPRTYLDWPAATYYTVVVRPGDTVYSIATRYDVPVAAVGKMNDLGSRDIIHPGDILRIPPGSERTRRIVLHEAASKRIYAVPHDSTHERDARVESAPIEPVREAHNDAPREAAPVPQYRPEESGGAVRFIWPVSGSVISGFGTTGSGERNDGINIAAAAGAPVRAAASGTVTYAGNELREYGNLVIIRHRGGYITVYAHERRLDVTKGEHVAQGQVIGTAGETGAVTRPQLHFEVRYHTNPVNPRPLLVASLDRASS
jgi:murein DD-endopeptidase MepM/ murein hydrolase activator NlpD